MNRTMRKLLTVVMVLALLLSTVAGAFAAEITSGSFRLSGVKKRVEEKAPEAPAEKADSEEEKQETVEEETTEKPAEEKPAEEKAVEEEHIEEEPTEEPTEEPAEEPAAAIGKATVSLKDANGNLNVRAEGNADGELINKIGNGESVSVLESKEGWTLIRTESGVEGWVSSAYLNIEEIPADEPSEEEPAEEPVEEEPVEEEPVEEEPVEEEPVEEEPVEEEPAEEPVEETPVEAAAEEEIPAEEELVEEAAEEVSDITAIGDADVRLEGNGMSEIFVTITEGTPLKVLGVEGDWVKVEIDGQIGYIFKDSVNGIEFETEVDEEGRPTPKVTVFISRRSVVSPGETIYLTSKLEGLDGYTLSFQWEVDKGNGFQIVPGANSDSHSFKASVETLAYDWRLTVNFE